MRFARLLPVLVVVHGCGAPQEGGADGRTLLRFAPRNGEQLVWQHVAELRGPYGPAVRMVFATRANVASGGAEVTLDETLEPLRMERDGTEASLEPLRRACSTPFRVRLRPDAGLIEPPRPLGELDAELGPMVVGLVQQLAPPRLPNRPVAIGDTWDGLYVVHVVTEGQRRELRVNAGPRLAAIDGETVVIEMNGDVSADDIVGEGVRMHIAGELRGSARVRIADGVVVADHRTLTMNLSAHDNGPDPLGLAVSRTAIHSRLVPPASLSVLPPTSDFMRMPRADAACARRLANAATRASHAPTGVPFAEVDLRAEAELPTASMGTPLEGGHVIVIETFPNLRIQFDERLITPPAPRPSLPAGSVLYVVADRRVPIRLLAQALAPFRTADLRLVIRDLREVPAEATWSPPDRADPGTPPLRSSVRTAIDAARRGTTGAERVRPLLSALTRRLLVCVPAMEASDPAPTGDWRPRHRAQILVALSQCDCDSAPLADIQALLEAIGGAGDLRWIPLQSAALDLASPGTVADLTAQSP